MSLQAFNDFERFPDDIACWAEGGNKFYNTTVKMNSGARQVNINWSQGLASFRISGGWRTINNNSGSDQYAIKHLIEFHDSMYGSAIGFRFKDFHDYQVTKENGLLGKSGMGTGIPKYQFYKSYSYGSNTTYRAIKKLVDGTIKVFVNGALNNDLTIDPNSGTIVFNPIKKATITNISVGSNCVVTTQYDNTFSSGETIYISGLNGSNSINNNAYIITVVSTNSFALNNTNNSLITYQGLAGKFPQPSDLLQFSGEFDIPCSFVDDVLDKKLNDQGFIELGLINIGELRI